MKQIRDAVVIGAGIIGSATALALVRAGVKRVTLIEKGPLVSGMTRRSVGLAHPFHGQAGLNALASASYDFYNQWAVRLGGKSSFVETGAAALMDAAMDGRSVSHAVNARQANVQAVPAGALANIFPAVSSALGEAIFTPRAGYADAVLGAQAMVNAAKERGLEVQTGTQVKQITVNGRHISGVKTTTGDLEAPAVIVAAGGWSERLLAPLGISLRLQFRRGAALFFEQPGESAKEFPILLDAVGSRFVRPHPYRMSAAGFVHTTPQQQGVDTIDEYVTPREETEVSRFLASCVPFLANVPPKRSHTMVYDTLADGLPALGKVSSFTGLYCALGFGTSAFAVAPAAGETVARIVIDGGTDSDVTFFDPLRTL